MTEGQKKFAEEYLVDLNPGEAYLRSGYTVTDRLAAQKSGSRMLKNAEVLGEIDRLQTERLRKSNIDNDWVVGRFRLVYLKATRDGDYSAALRALENIAKHVGFYLEDNKQKTGKDSEANKQRLRDMGFDPDKLFRVPEKASQN